MSYPAARTTNQESINQPLLPTTNNDNNSNPTQVIYVENAESRRRKHYAGGACCVLLSALVLLLIFLIPRGPSIQLTGGMVELSGVPINVNASFLFRNTNWYETTFENLHFSLLSNLGQIGEGSFKGPITLKAKRSQVINIGISTLPGTGLNIKDYCRFQPAVLMYLANSTCQAHCEMKDFGTVHVYSPVGALFMCQQQ